MRLVILTLLALAPAFSAQDAPTKKLDGFPGLGAGRMPEVEIPWNRLYDYPEIYAHLDRLVSGKHPTQNQTDTPARQIPRPSIQLGNDP